MGDKKTRGSIQKQSEVRPQENPIKSLPIPFEHLVCQKIYLPVPGIVIV